MAKNITAYLQGPVLYACVFPSNMKKEGQYVPEGGEYTIMIGLDKEDAKLVKKWNRLYVGKDRDAFEEPKQGSDEPREVPEGFVDGVLYFTFRRRNKVWKKNGELIEEWSGAPEVVDADDNPWDPEVMIGNGSICSIKLDVFMGKNAEGKDYTSVRIDKIRVDQHVPFEAPEKEEVETETVSRVKVPF